MDVHRKLTSSENQARHLATVGRNPSADLRRQLEVSEQHTQNLVISKDESKALQLSLLHAENLTRSECEDPLTFGRKTTKKYHSSKAKLVNITSSP